MLLIHMPLQPFAMEDLTILFEDEDLLVINKPAGLRVIPDGYHVEFPSIKSILGQQYGRIFIVHRLDKGTSGILLVAKNDRSHRILNTQFQNHEVHKVYHAILISPTPFPAQLEVDASLRVNGDHRHRTVVDQMRGKAAATVFELITQYRLTALVKALPKTGYTHQIRAHALYAGFPLLGDDLYGFPSAFPRLPNDLPSFSRPALHAFQISFVQPSSGVRLEFTCPDPPDFLEFLAHQKKMPKGIPSASVNTLAD